MCTCSYTCIGAYAFVGLQVHMCLWLRCEATCDQYISLAKRHLKHWRRAGGRCTIKHHYDLHLADLVKVHGNPSYYSTVADESFNR